MNLSVSSVGNNIDFGYKSILKDMYKDGKLPSVTRGLYGKRLNKKNVSLEHMIPHSKGGPSKLSNYALADRYINTERGNEDIRKFLTPDMAKKYFMQFKDLIIRYRDQIFNGNDYIKNGLATLKKLGIVVDLKG